MLLMAMDILALDGEEDPMVSQDVMLCLVITLDGVLDGLVLVAMVYMVFLEVGVDVVALDVVVQVDVEEVVDVDHVVEIAVVDFNFLNGVYVSIITLIYIYITVASWTWFPGNCLCIVIY